MHFRLTQPNDFHIARGFIPAAYRYSPAALDALPEIWGQLLRAGQLISAVLEETGNAPESQVLGVGLSVFVSDQFADDVLADRQPYLNARLHDMLLAGHSPVLKPCHIAEGNLNGGLNLLPLHFCTASFDIQNLDVMRTLSAAQDLFRVMHAGYKIKRIIKEVTNINLCRFMQSTGMNLVCDYAADRPDLGLNSLPEVERPYLLSIRHDEMPLGSQMSLMLIAGPVRFHFSPAEQKLLLCALLREADGDIAADLSLSADTVRTHWRSIFQRVMAVDPWFFPDTAEAQAEDTTRGRGKRRHLLRYLQLHMEELRPHLGRGKSNGGVHGA